VGISRRSIILGSAVLGTAAGIGGWGLLADARLVPGRSAVDTLLGRCDLPGPPPPEADPGLVVEASFYSTSRARSVGYALAYPPGAKAGASLPVCLVLHGVGDDFRSPIDGLRSGCWPRRSAPGCRRSCSPRSTAARRGGTRERPPATIR
jgi:hypothetical protein